MGRKPSIKKEFDLIEEDAKNAPVDDIHWKGKEMDVESDTHLEDDKGEGKAVIIRKFSFAKNPDIFNTKEPTRQDIFNSHVKGIEVMLWKDGLKIMTDVEPRITFDEEHYSIFVGAEPQRGHSLTEAPKKLKELIHESR